MKMVMIIAGVVVVLLLATLGVLQFMNGEEPVAPPEVPAPKQVQPTEEQISGNYTEPIAQKFSYPSSDTGGIQEIAIDKVAVAGLNKSQASVTYTITTNVLTAPKWILKRVRLFNVPNASAYEMKIQNTSKRGRNITIDLTATVPAGALLNNNVALSVSAPDGSDEITLLHQIPTRARPLPAEATPPTAPEGQEEGSAGKAPAKQGNATGKAPAKQKNQKSQPKAKKGA